MEILSREQLKALRGGLVDEGDGDEGSEDEWEDDDEGNGFNPRRRCSTGSCEAGMPPCCRNYHCYAVSSGNRCKRPQILSPNA